MSDTITKLFSFDDQHHFAALSGDSNPMHMDPIAARRTQAGKPVVHGMHTLLWALNSLAIARPDLRLPRTVRADFTSFLPVGSTAVLGRLSDDANPRVAVSCDGLTVMSVELRYGCAISGRDAPVRRPDPEPAVSPSSAIVLDLSEVEGQHGSVAFATGLTEVEQAFPNATQWLGRPRVAAMLCCTRLVGMVCPGLHSIFNRIDADFVAIDESANHLDYAVSSVDPRFRRAKISVSGGGMVGNLVTSVRHPPIRQSDIPTLASSVDPVAFLGAKALVVGGSRGLGELTAKILAAGGADLIITYARGQADAERVAKEIIDWGGKCRVLQYDCLKDAAYQLGGEAASITHCYYYATSPIFAPSSRLFDKARFDTFTGIYVEGFYNLFEALRAASVTGVNMYYPSSTSVAERPPGMNEYAMVKAAGEVMCAELNQRQKTMRVLVCRLPRLATDQTASLVAEEAVSAFDIILPLVKQVQSATT